MTKILPVVLQPHPALSAKAEPVAQITLKVLESLEAMLATMHRADGVGLAAPQLDIRQRLVVVDLGEVNEKAERKRGASAPKFLINPEITWKSSETETRLEGCLSLPGLWGDVTRPARVKFSYLDRDGATREEEAEGLMAAVIQHEIDHLDGIIFPQRTSRLRQEMLMKKWKRLREELLQYGGQFDVMTHDRGLINAGVWRGDE